MPVFGGRPNPTPEPEPQIPDEEGLTAEQIAILAMRWKNLMDSGFTADEAFQLCENPGLDWHYAADLRRGGCPFAIILDLTSP